MIIDTVETDWETQLALRPTQDGQSVIIIWNTRGEEGWHWRRPGLRWLGYHVNLTVALEKAMVDYDRIMKERG